VPLNRLNQIAEYWDDAAYQAVSTASLSAATLWRRRSSLTYAAYDEAQAALRFPTAIWMKARES
jgi:hypothetical protein